MKKSLIILMLVFTLASCKKDSVDSLTPPTLLSGITWVTTSNVNLATFTYDSGNALNAFTNGTGGYTWPLTYNSAGLITSIGTAVADPYTYTFTYNNANVLTNIRWVQYFSAGSNIAPAIRDMAPTLVNGRVASLVVTDPASPSSGSYRIAFTYDATGNVIKLSQFNSNGVLASDYIYTYGTNKNPRVNSRLPFCFATDPSVDINLFAYNELLSVQTVLYVGATPGIASTYTFEYTYKNGFPVTMKQTYVTPSGTNISNMTFQYINL